MRRGRACPICIADPMLRAKVDSLLESGAAYREISALIGFDKYKVARHRKHAFPAVANPVPAGDELGQCDERLHALANQLSTQYTAAISCGDNKVALEITKVLARLETERHRRIVIRKQSEIDNPESDPLKSGAPSSAFLDHVKNKVWESFAKACGQGAIMCPCCGGRPVNPATVLGKFREYENRNTSM